MLHQAHMQDQAVTMLLAAMLLATMVLVPMQLEATVRAMIVAMIHVIVGTNLANPQDVLKATALMVTVQHVAHVLLLKP